MDTALRALNRFGLGARFGERRRVRDPRGWLRAQVDGGPPLVEAPAAGSPVAISDAIRAFRMPAQPNRQRPRQPPPTEILPEAQRPPEAQIGRAHV